MTWDSNQVQGPPGTGKSSALSKWHCADQRSGAKQWDLVEGGLPELLLLRCRRGRCAGLRKCSTDRRALAYPTLRAVSCDPGRHCPAVGPGGFRELLAGLLTSGKDATSAAARSVLAATSTHAAKAGLCLKDMRAGGGQPVLCSGVWRMSWVSAWDAESRDLSVG